MWPDSADITVTTSLQLSGVRWSWCAGAFGWSVMRQLDYLGNGSRVRAISNSMRLGVCAFGLVEPVNRKRHRR